MNVKFITFKFLAMKYRNIFLILLLASLSNQFKSLALVALAIQSHDIAI